MVKIKEITQKDIEELVRSLSMQSLADYQPIFLRDIPPENQKMRFDNWVKLQVHGGKKWIDITDYMSFKEMKIGIKLAISYTYRENRARERLEKLREECPEVASEQDQDEFYQKRRGEYLKKTNKRSSPVEHTEGVICVNCHRSVEEVDLEITPCCHTVICWDFCLYEEPKKCPFCKAPWDVVQKDPVTKEAYIELLEKEIDP